MNEATRELLAQVELFARAFQSADADVLRPMLTEGYIHINGLSGSVLNKDQWLEFIKT